MIDLAGTFGPDALSILRRHNLLPTLLQALIAEEAIKSIELPAEVQEQLLAQACGQRSREDAEAGALEKFGWSAEDFAWQVMRPAKLQQWANEQFLPKAEARFLQRKDQFDQVVYSLLRCKEATLARELYLRISSGEASFAEVVAQYSEGPEQKTGGVVGPCPIKQAHPLLAERLRTARDGEVLEPFPAADWWLVVRRDQFMPARFDDAMADQMAKELMQDWLQTEAQTQLAALQLQP